MELKEYLAVIAARKWLVFTVLMAVVGVAVAATLQMTKTYEAAATVRVQPQSALSNDPVRADDVTYLAQLQNTYSKLATDRTFVDDLQTRLGLHRKPKLDVSTKPNTELMEIRAEDRNRYVAANVATAGAQLLIDRVRQFGEQSLKRAEEVFRSSSAALQKQIAEERQEYERLVAAGASQTSPRVLNLSTDIQLKQTTLIDQQRQFEDNRLAAQARANSVQLVENAAVPSSPAKPNLKMNIALAIVVGLFAAIGLAFLLERLQPKIHFTDDVESIVGLPVIGTIPTGTGKGVFNSGSPAEEAFRTLRMNVTALNGSTKPLTRLLITSAAPNEGKSTISANLAASLASSGSRVVLVDGDLRIPTLHQIFKVPNGAGLSDVLQGQCSLRQAVQPTDTKNLWLLSSGPAVEKPAELLASRKMEEVLDELEERFDVVVVDSPALLGLSDSLALARDATGVLLVVRKSKTRRDQFESAHRGLEGVRAKPLGVIVNGVGPAGGYYHYYRGGRRRR